MLQIELSTELYWLTLTTVMTSVLCVPYILNRMLEQGILKAMWDKFGSTKTEKPWANRMMQAHINAVENLVVFAPLVLLVQFTGKNSEITAIACMVFFFARLTHYLVFTFAVPLLRVVAFLTGFGSQVTLGLVILSQI